MIKHTLTHPGILQALAANGHGGKIVITDGNFPAGTSAPPSCTTIYLNLRKDSPSVTEVVSTVMSAIVIESAVFMDAPDHSPQQCHTEYSELLGNTPTTRLTRFEFYDAANKKDVFLMIVTGDSRRFANIILTMGVYR